MSKQTKKKIILATAERPVLTPEQKKLAVDLTIKTLEKRIWKAIANTNIATAALAMANVYTGLADQPKADEKYHAMLITVLERVIAAIRDEDPPLPGQSKLGKEVSTIIQVDALGGRRGRSN